MEKLIELLNKFIKEKKHYHWTFENENEVSKYECLIISKQFKFIRRLVENDKIDFEMEMDTLPFREKYDIKKSEFLIMLLSISDEPIRFLISVLK